MSYEGGYGQDNRGNRGRGGRRGRGRGSSYYNNDNRNQGIRYDQPERNRNNPPGYAQQEAEPVGTQNPAQTNAKKEVGKHTKDRVKEELSKLAEDKQTYTKFQLLEMFTSVPLADADYVLNKDIDSDLIITHSQNPVLLEEAENELTLDELRPRKGMGGPPRKRNDFGGNDRPTDDLEEEDEPEWLDFKPQEKKFDFSKQVPLKKMFDNDRDTKFEALEDDEDEDETMNTQSSQQLPPGNQPISIEELERQQFKHLDHQKPTGMGFGTNSQMQPPPFDQNQHAFGMPAQPNAFPGFGGNIPQQMPSNKMPPPQNSQQMPPQNQQPGQMMGGFPGFPGNDAFGGFGPSMGQPLGSQGAFGDSMGFGSSMFGAPYGRDEEFEKIFGQPSQPPSMGNYFPGGDPTKQDHNDLGGMFNFGMGDNQFMAQAADDDEDEDDWLMDDQFQNKHLGFIDQHGDTPSKQKAPLDEVEDTTMHVKPEEIIERAYKYQKTERRRVAKPRKVHTFEPRLKEKKRFESLFDKEETQEEIQNKKPYMQDLSLYLIKKYWDMKEDPSTLDALNLIQNPFSFHITNKRNCPPQFFVNKEGPVHVTDLFLWFNLGRVPKTFLIGHDENCFMYNSKPTFLFEKYFNDHANELFSAQKVPEEEIKKTTQNEVEGVAEEEIKPEESKKQQRAPHMFDPAISNIIHDEAITMIDASQLESQLLQSASQPQPGRHPNMMGAPPGQPFDPAIVSFQSASHKKY